MYTLGNRFASAREVKEVRDRNTRLETQLADLTARVLEIERQRLEDGESRLKEQELVLQREQEAKRKFTEMELENAGLKGQLAMLERVLAEGPCRVINQQGGRLGGGSEDVGNAAGSDGGHQGEGDGSGAGPITHRAPTSAATPATYTDLAPSSGSGVLSQSIGHGYFGH